MLVLHSTEMDSDHVESMRQMMVALFWVLKLVFYLSLLKQSQESVCVILIISYWCYLYWYFISARLEPGKMFLVDLKEKRVVKDEELKQKLAAANNYGSWLEEQQITWDHINVSKEVSSLMWLGVVMPFLIFRYYRKNQPKLTNMSWLKTRESTPSDTLLSMYTCSLLQCWMKLMKDLEVWVMMLPWLACLDSLVLSTNTSNNSLLRYIFFSSYLSNIYI